MSREVQLVVWAAFILAAVSAAILLRERWVVALTRGLDVGRDRPRRDRVVPDRELPPVPPCSGGRVVDLDEGQLGLVGRSRHLLHGLRPLRLEPRDGRHGRRTERPRRLARVARLRRGVGGARQLWAHDDVARGDAEHDDARRAGGACRAGLERPRPRPLAHPGPRGRAVPQGSRLSLHPYRQLVRPDANGPDRR